MHRHRRARRPAPQASAKDGSYWSSPTKSGACRGHKGIQTWYADAAGASAAPGTAAAKPTPGSPLREECGKRRRPPQPKRRPPQAPHLPAPQASVRMAAIGPAPTKSGACRGHQGIQTWYADAAAAAPMKPASMACTRASCGNSFAPSPGTLRRCPRPPCRRRRRMERPRQRLAKVRLLLRRPSRLPPGGGMGLVWVNTESNVYHCNGDVYYGKTKAGQYMSEAAAQAKGAHGDRGKTCAGK